MDLNGDGRPELLLANKLDPSDLNTSFIYVFDEVGAAGRPAYRARGTLGVTGAYHQAPAFADLDGDGDQDMVLGSFGQDVRFFENRGSRTEARFVLVDSALVTLTRGSNATPVLGDLDADGDLDLLVGESSGTINFYRNVGGARAAREYAGIEVERRSAPALLDLDGDGDLDLLAGTEREGVRLWRNEGGRQEPRFVPAGTVLGPDDVHAYSVPLPADRGGGGGGGRF
jgi:hypothetical protein